MQQKNLKGNFYNLSYYRLRPTGEAESKMRRNGDKEQTYTKKELEKIFLKEEEVRQFSLDKHGTSLPHMDGNITFINNYLMDYWGHYFSAEGFALYMHLKRYCYGDIDYCWPDLDLIGAKMKKSRNTIKKYLAILESYGFVLMFNVMNGDKNNMEESPLFKIRRQVPFLPQELYNKLPLDLKIDHDKFMQRLVGSHDISGELERSLDYTLIYDNILKQGTVVRKPKSDDKKSAERTAKQKILHEQITEDDRNVWTEFCKIIKTKISPPSFDTWFKGSFCVRTERTYCIYSPTLFCKEWLESRFKEQITEIFKQMAVPFDEITFDHL
ncbi:hypothetical protein ABE82_26670 (plasmid) [Paenibacillus peoriae]|uniref:DnaA N-terminal domain-containing protein n=1 Tax=Paenibacillus peoriae TaxID=59893 RepID=UPI00071EECCD|nr:DnaA N-terminal domain-containing protein [Paenibacillus peoriae]ALS09997.1 hypothetical protein ABE82_26670 [Paenibacillus peoriae]